MQYITLCMCVCVCRENRTKTGLWWEGHKDSTGAAATGNEVLGFNLLINYTFQPHLSNGLNPNTTLITVPNLPLMVCVCVSLIPRPIIV